MLFILLAACFCSSLTQNINAQCIGAYNGLAADNLAWQSGNALAWDAASAPWSASSCAGPAAYSGLNYALNEWSAGYSPSNLAASYGGGLAVTSMSPISPTGVSMTSENAYEGPLSVAGTIPFLGAVALEGALPTGGAGSVSYACGNGNVAMINEDYAGYGAGPLGSGYGYNGFGPAAYEGYNGLSTPLAVEAGRAGVGYGYNVNNARLGGCGCGAVY
ncbi:chorion class CB protein M5H4 precursor [Danaus plexippus plexippus]|uniref:Chorion class CB protein M5H4 n=1 Tax=Danaus plexippus plexippus TaxID=278856 RepID=A0A212EZB3_DANPL|nr:chorion class CB protein M5H4 precursor [Danaus plexippus plexippus]